MESANIPVPQAENPECVLEQFAAFIEIVQILRKECPWDKKQTNESISHLIIEEAYEALDAVNKKDDDGFAKELGDLLLHIVMHSVMANERKAFDLNDVIINISEKMVRRHPHVFGSVNVDGENDVLNNWEDIKKKQEGRKSTLEGVPDSLPALLKAERIQQKVSRVGFDWDNKEDVWKKVYEELGELKAEFEKNDKEKSKEELGDLLFAIVNAARHEDIVPEEALQSANRKFARRFDYIEKMAEQTGKDLKSMSLEEMDKLWDEAKSKE